MTAPVFFKPFFIRSASALSSHKFLITGGAGFIGGNLADRLLSQGEDVAILDSLYRPGSEKNLAWLRRRHGDRLRHHALDLRDAKSLAPAFADRTVIIHTAGQTAVTTSIADPRVDFEMNALGTFNALEAARLAGNQPVFLLTSTNKVYGGLDDVGVTISNDRWEFSEKTQGIDERQPLNFHSPYGCSKGAADQYVRDYARIYGIRAVVFRMSCICGPRQFGTEDQGWVAHFVISVMKNRDIILFGDGKQARDILFVTDLLDAMQAAIERIETARGQVYNIGGGPDNAISLLELLDLLEGLLRRKIPRRHADRRPGDQAVYVSDIRKAGRELAWKPKVSREEAIQRMIDWVRCMEQE